MSEAPLAVLGLFPSPQALVDAVPKVRAAGFSKLEAYTPYPVHHLDEVLGFKRSPLGFLVLVMGLAGTFVAVAFQGWTNAFDYPVVTGGKPLFSWQAFVPIMFEVTVLFATFTAGLAMLFVLNKLPFFGHPVLGSKAIAHITRDKFALSIEPKEGVADPQAAARALEAAGAQDIEVVRARGLEPSGAGHDAMHATLDAPMGPPASHTPSYVEAELGLSPRSILRLAGKIFLACAVAGLATFALIKSIDLLPPFAHIQDQPKVKAQQASTFFADGLSMRTPVGGTVARGHLPYLFKTPEEAGATLLNPLPRSEQVLEDGRRLFDTQCSVCHGGLGTGETTLSSAYGAQPANLHSAAIRDYPDGHLYHVIVAGKNTMPGYAAYLSEDERWSVVHYLRALQRARNARDEDLR